MRHHNKKWLTGWTPILAFLSLSVSAGEFNSSYVLTRPFSDGQYCVYKHHQSGRLFVMKLPDVGCPQRWNVSQDLLGQAPPPVFDFFWEEKNLPVDPPTIDRFFERRKHIVDYRFGTTDTAEYEAIVAQLNRCSAFQVDIMGTPFVMTHDTNYGKQIMGKAGIKGDTSLRVYSFQCTQSENRGPSCAVICEKHCGEEVEMYVIEPIADTPYSVMYRGLMPNADADKATD